MTDRIIHCPLDAPEAQLVLDGLAEEYGRRYGTARAGGARGDIDRYPPDAFVPPMGDFLILVRDGKVIAGGAYMSHDDETVEIKRMWAHPDHRREGLARRILVALEEGAAGLGYTRTYLTTGFRQPEAVALYLSMGYRPMFDVSVDPEFYRSLPFEKHIGAQAGQPGRSAVRRAAGSFAEASAEVNATKAAQEVKILQRLARHADQRAVA